MSVTYDDTNRQAVPRCLPYETACSLGLLRANRIREALRKGDVKTSDARREWTENHRIASAVDLVAEALIVRDFQSSEAIEAANFILSKAPLTSSLIGQLARHFLEKPTSVWKDPGNIPNVDVNREYIARLKRSVRQYPFNPIEWSNLSLSYATIGQDDKAKMAMNVALNLAPKNRFILRSASRCFMHLDDPERGVAILHKSGLCASDPWIASAEIAISQSVGLRSKCISKGRDLILDDNLTPISRSELSLGLGTLELKSGAVRKAKKIIRKALIDPTENALAQTEWAASTFKIDFDNLIRLRTTVPASYEASAVYSYYNKEFEESLNASKKWGKFQFLSDRPIILSTFISSCLLNDDLGAISIFLSAFPVQKASSLAINNYAFALARTGQTKEAKKALYKALRSEPSRREEVTINATMGLICFREGYIEEGRELYDKAVREFELIREFRSAAIARYYLAVEEKRINSQNAASRIMEAKREIERYNVSEFIDMIMKL